MKIAVLGGGPAGLYFSILMKRADPRHEITVVERNDPDATFGWGVVFSEGSLDELKDADYESYVTITESFARWDPIDVRYKGQTVRCRGHVFSGVGRRELLNILQRRAGEVGVTLQFHTEINDLAPFMGADLVVGADGANSVVRKTLAEWFRPRIDLAPSKYAWYGADMAFPVFTYIFKETEWGLFQAHCYPYNENRSTMVLLCNEDVWARAGLDRMSEQESLEFCERVFAEDLDGHHMLSNRSLWTNFPWISCDSWHRDNVVILGDAAHTAHWSIGSGTKLALEDAIALAKAFRKHRTNREAALTEFEMERQPPVERFQAASRISCDYFQNLCRYTAFEPWQFTYQLMTRTPRITHANLSLRDPEFIRSVECWFAARAVGDSGKGLRTAPPPMFAPLKLRGLTVPNRVVLAPVQKWDRALSAGAGLVLTEIVAVSADGRVTLETPVADGSLRAPSAGSVVALQLGHAGRRGATRPRRCGVDRPLREGAWPLLSASAIRYAPWSPIPREMGRADMNRVREDFAAAARHARAAGFQMLVLNFAHGYMLASFISPLSNQRTDEFGGSLERRMRYPCEVLEAVRDAWAPDLPIAVAISATDWMENGLSPQESVEAARLLARHGCDLVYVLTGQTIFEAKPEYGPAFAVPFSDRIRNEAGVATMVAGHITTGDEMNTILAAGRADLCVWDDPSGHDDTGAPASRG